MPRYKLTIAYDGTNFCGWQKQEPFAPEGDDRPEDQKPAREGEERDAWAGAEALEVREGEDRPRVALRTVQHVVERAVRSIVREPVVVMGASRTDAGVHAKGQAAAFTCTGEEGGAAGWPESRGTDRLWRAINGRLPEDVQVVGCEVASATFDPIGDAVEKKYAYTIAADAPSSEGHGLAPLWDRWFVHQVFEPLDVARMNEGASRLVGEHDFASFAAAGHGRLTTVRTIYGCRVVEAAGSRRIRIEVSGNGFLYNMVRIIAGTLVEVGRGRMTPEDVSRALASGDRRQAGPTLPARGLCLEWVRY